NPKFYALSTAKKGKYLLDKGDAEKERNRIGKAITYYEEAGKYCSDEAKERLNKISSIFSIESKSTSAKSTQGVHPPNKKAELTPKDFKLAGPYFPTTLPAHSSTSNYSIHSSDSLPQGLTNYTIQDAPSTLALAHMFRNANDADKKEIRDIIDKIIRGYDENSSSTEHIQELTVLAAIPDPQIFISIISQFLKIEMNSPTFPEMTIHGLAVILTSAPEEITLKERQGLLTDILGRLQFRLEKIRIENNNDELLPLLGATSALFDSMLCRKFKHLGRADTYNPVMNRLNELAADDTINPEVAFWARYATQSLAYIGNDESFAMSIYRRGRLAIGVIDDIKSAVLDFNIVAFESAYEKIMSMSDFNIKMEWYQGLLFLDCLLASDDILNFEKFVIESKLSKNEYFMQGVCLRLEQIASSHLNHDVSLGAQRLLQDLESNPATRVQATARIALNRLEATGSSTPRAPAESRLAPVWDSFWYSDTNSRLLKSVQDTLIRDSNMLTVGSTLSVIQTNLKKISPTQCSMVEVNKALLDHYSRQLTILRVSSEPLGLESCYINLAIVEAISQRKKDKEELTKQKDSFIRMPSFEDVSFTNTEKPIPLNAILDKRKLLSGEEEVPKRILIIGRAGVGKTTFCKKLVYEFSHNRLWNDRFGALLWLPLRLLKGYKARSLEELLVEKYFIIGSKNVREGLALEFIESAKNGKVLFVLDGLDEFVTESDTEVGDALHYFVMTLLDQPNVIVTTRPYGNDRSLLSKLDLELETVGFSTENVEQYVEATIQDPNASKAVLDFIRQTPLIQGLVNIPIQLDLICYSWKDLVLSRESTTITQLYQTIVRKLWCKDAIRMRKKIEDRLMTEELVENLLLDDIDANMTDTIEFLGYLAFQGLKTNHQLIFNKKNLVNAAQEINRHRLRMKPSQPKLPFDFIDEMKKSSILHKTEGEETWSFLHLTFQEYFAATWFSQYFQAEQPNSDIMSRLIDSDKIISFIKLSKYNPRYEIVWWMMAGQLEGKALESYFQLLQEAPRDLIGVRHQLLVVGCYKEANSRLPVDISNQILEELVQWLRFELTFPDYLHERSILGRHSVFPEEVLIKSLGGPKDHDKKIIRSLRYRRYLKSSTIEELIERTNYSDPDITILAVQALGNQFTVTEPSMTAIIHTLKHKDARVREAAVKAMSNQSTLSESMETALITALCDENRKGKVREAAAMAFYNQSTLSDSAITALVTALQDPQWNVKAKAAKALGNQSTLSEPTITALLTALQDEDSTVRMEVVEALNNQSTLPGFTETHLATSLKDGVTVVRKGAASVLSKHSPLSETTMTALATALQDHSPEVRIAVANTLGNQPTISKSTAAALVIALGDENLHVVNAVAEVLCSQIDLSASTEAALVTNLQSLDGIVRYTSARALRNQPKLSKSTTAELIGILQDEDEKWHVRGEAINTLGSLSTLSEPILKALVTALQDEHSYVRRAAANALGNQSTLSVSATIALAAIIQDSDWCVRYAAVSALGNQSTLSDYATTTLVTALQDKEWRVREEVAKVLGNQSTLSESTMTALVTALQIAVQDVVNNVRDAIIKALNNQSNLSESIASVLATALKNDDWQTKEVAAMALNGRSALSESTMIALLDALDDDYTDVKTSAAIALGKQSTLSESNLALITASMSNDYGRPYVFNELGIQRMYLSVKDLDADKIEMVYRDDFFDDSCSHYVSLFIHENQLRIYTEQGFGQTSELRPEVLDKIKSAFMRVQQSGGIKYISY
ncbi:hypothetical protein BGZ76_002022, partial [Entomortierella beljakovae]